MPNPVIVIPGIKGSGLENLYALPPATTWSAVEAGNKNSRYRRSRFFAGGALRAQSPARRS